MPPTTPLSPADAAHLLRRTGYGGTPAEIAAFTGLTRETAVSHVLGHDAGSPAPLGPDVGEPAFLTNPNQWIRHTDAIEWWIQRMADSSQPAAHPAVAPAVSAPLPIHEKLTWFWHDHFACGQQKVIAFNSMWQQIRDFRILSLGSFDELLRTAAVSSAMLLFLDNHTNVAANPQENFGRELLELYSCGVGNYTEADVVAMTRAWTGHGIVGDNGSFWDPSYQYWPDRHDHGTKTIFGIADNWNGVAVEAGERDTITELVHGARRDETATFIARKLFRWFAHLSPPPAVVAELADAFVAGGMEISALVRAVLLHEEFWAPTTRYAQVKMPVDFVVTALRQTGVGAADVEVRARVEDLGQVPFDPQSVAGWPSGSAWVTTSSIWARGAFAQRMRQPLVAGGVLAGLATETDAGVVADQLFSLLGLTDVSAASRDAIEDWHTAAVAADANWATPFQSVLLGLLLPEFQVF